jgi:hypothetical protein
LEEIHKLAEGKVSLGAINYGGGSVTVTGSATNVDAIYRYARALRASKDSVNELRFSSVWIPSISGGKGFTITLTK